MTAIAIALLLTYLFARHLLQPPPKPPQKRSLEDAIAKYFEDGKK